MILTIIIPTIAMVLTVSRMQLVSETIFLFCHV